MPTTIISDIITSPRHQHAILIVASLSSRLPRYMKEPNVLCNGALFKDWTLPRNITAPDASRLKIELLADCGRPDSIRKIA